MGTGRGGPLLTRRAVVKGCGAAALAAAVAGCGPGGKKPAAASSSTTPPPASVEPAAAGDWAALAARLTGRLVRPGDAGYLTDVQLYDFRYDATRPAAIAYCANPDDVARSIAFARAHGLTPTPRAGGHSYGGYSTGAGLVVDVTPMRSVTAGSGTATIGAGARLIDVYTPLNAAGVSVPAGSCPTVGITGLALGGGLGVVCRSEGLTSDRVSSLRVVTADSRVVTASATENPDLFWACRGGGGGNFGVVTSLELETFATAEVALVTLTWPWAAAAEVLPAWQHWMLSAPDEMWSNCLLLATPGAPEATLKVTGVHRGPASDAAAVVSGLTSAAGPPASYYVGPADFGHAMYVEAGCDGLSEDACHLPTQAPGGTLSRQPSVAKSDLLTSALADAAVRLVVDAVAERQAAGLQGATGYDALGGATAGPAADATAWVHRDAVFSAQYSVPLQAGGAVAGDVAWLDGLYRSLRPYVSGQAYQNYIDPALAGWEQAYYGSNLPRLERVRRRWDPDGTFSFAQAIPRSA